MSNLAKKIISNPESRRKLEAALKDSSERKVVIVANNKKYILKKVSSLNIE